MGGPGEVLAQLLELGPLLEDLQPVREGPGPLLGGELRVLQLSPVVGLPGGSLGALPVLGVGAVPGGVGVGLGHL